MTVLAHLSTKSLIITRRVATSGYKYNYAGGTVTGIKADLQPLNAQKTALVDGVMGKTFVIYSDGTLGIVEGDRLRDINTGELYQVMNGGVSRRVHGSIDFLEITVQLIN